MAEDFYPFVDPSTPTPDNTHITGQAPDGAIDEVSAGTEGEHDSSEAATETVAYATRISVYDDLFSTPHVIVIKPAPVRTYLEEITNTVYRLMKEQGGSLSLMVIREIVENFIHAHFVEPIISILDGGSTIRFADQGPGIDDKERAFEFGVTSADRDMKRYIRGTGSGLPMVQQYLEAAGGAISIENNLGGGTVVTVSTDAARVEEIKRSGGRGAAVRPGEDPRVASVGTTRSENVPYSNATAAPYGMTTVSQGTGAGPYPMNYQPMYSQQPPAQYPLYAYPAPAYGGEYQTAAYPTAGAAGGGGPAPYGAVAGCPTESPTAGSPNTGGAGGPNTYPAAAQPVASSPYGYTPGYGYQPGASGEAQAGTPQNTQLGNTGTSMPGYPASSGVNQQQNTMAGSSARPLIVSDRGRLALTYLLEHGHGGPTELAETFGQSGPTWSRELTTLSKRGFIFKQGQKYYLTELGASWVRANEERG